MFVFRSHCICLHEVNTLHIAILNILKHSIHSPFVVVLWWVSQQSARVRIDFGSTRIIFRASCLFWFVDDWCFLPFILSLWHSTLLSVFIKRWGCSSVFLFLAGFLHWTVGQWTDLFSALDGIRNSSRIQRDGMHETCRIITWWLGISRHNFLACFSSITHWAGIIWYWILILGKYPVVLKAFTVLDTEGTPHQWSFQGVLFLHFCFNGFWHGEWHPAVNVFGIGQKFHFWGDAALS